LVRHEFEAIEMAIPFRIVLYARDGQQATNAAQAAFARIHELNGSLSDYDPQSELSRLSQTAGTGKTVPLSSDLARVLECANQVSRATDGAFDVTVGPLTQLWRRARRQRALPEPSRLEEARRAVGWSHLELAKERGAGSVRPTARLTQPGMRLDLGGIAKGYALDEATRVLRAHGLKQTLVTGAGDMVAGDPPPHQSGWKIDLPPLDLPGAPPLQTLWIHNGALCTSGDLFQHVEIDGVRYSHIVDPRVGLGLTDHSLVTVLGRDGMISDAFSTAISVLPVEESLRIAPRFGVQFRSIRAPGGEVSRVQTPHFPR
jgi:thiamine biosynthesis lipoprotein